MNAQQNHKPGQIQQLESTQRSITEIADTVGEIVEAESIGEMSSIGGLGLIVDLAQLSEDLVARASQRGSTTHGNAPLAIDPRNRIDPRKRFRPR